MDTGRAVKGWGRVAEGHRESCQVVLSSQNLPYSLMVSPQVKETREATEKPPERILKGTHSSSVWESFSFPPDTAESWQRNQRDVLFRQK